MSRRRSRYPHEPDVRNKADEKRPPPDAVSGRGERSGSALGGKIDYADLAERVVQGVTVTKDAKRRH